MVDAAGMWAPVVGFARMMAISALPPRTDHVRGLVATLVVAAAWLALAAWRPTSTFHLAPFVAAGAWPLLLRRGPLRVAAVDAAGAAAAASVLAVGVGVGLQLADLLRGPTLWGSGAALVEVPLAAAAGAVVGYRYARCGVAVLDDEPDRSGAAGERVGHRFGARGRMGR